MATANSIQQQEGSTDCGVFSVAAVYHYTLIVITGKISLFALDAYFHSGMPIFTVKMGIRMPIFT